MGKRIGSRLEATIAVGLSLSVSVSPCSFSHPGHVLKSPIRETLTFHFNRILGNTRFGLLKKQEKRMN